MKISIITPTYNSDKYIKETMDSIHDQSYRDFEHIVVDGLSNDRTLDIVKTYSQVFLISEKDKGQSDALNKGFSLAKGDILAWQNSDDLYFKDTFKSVVECFQANPDIDVVYGFYQLIGSKGEWICDVYPIKWNATLFSRGRFCPPQPTVFWRKSVWQKCGPLNEALHYCMDVDFYSRSINSNFKFRRVDKMLGKFRIHESSKTQNKNNQRDVKREYMNVLKKNFRFNLIDVVIFEFFQFRSKITKSIKLNFLKRI
jgi:glycosyltransferase involved in cell wall biosynthesis